MIGPVPGLPKTFFAAGHEGEGLSLVIFFKVHLFESATFIPLILLHLLRINMICNETVQFFTGSGNR